MADLPWKTSSTLMDIEDLRDFYGRQKASAHVWTVEGLQASYGPQKTFRLSVDDNRPQVLLRTIKGLLWPMADLPWKTLGFSIFHRPLGLLYSFQDLEVFYFATEGLGAFYFSQKIWRHHLAAIYDLEVFDCSNENLWWSAPYACRLNYVAIKNSARLILPPTFLRLAFIPTSFLFTFLIRSHVRDN